MLPRLEKNYFAIICNNCKKYLSLQRKTHPDGCSVIQDPADMV